MIRINLPFTVPSVNHLYWHKNNIKIMKKPARELREKIILEVQKQVDQVDLTKLKNKRLIVNVVCYNGWFYKNGKVKKKDVHNKEKFLVDSIFKGLKSIGKEFEIFDDKFIWDSRFMKGELPNEEEGYTVIDIDAYSNEFVEG